MSESLDLAFERIASLEARTDATEKDVSAIFAKLDSVHSIANQIRGGLILAAVAVPVVIGLLQ